MANKLCINISKTHFMFFASRNCHCIDSMLLENSTVKRVYSTKFLGVHIDEKLSWSVHIHELITKLSKSVGLLRVSSECIPRNVLLSIFFAFFYSQVSYGILIWGSTYKSYLQPINVLYKKCLRLLCGKPFLEHTPPLAKSLNVVIFDDLYALCLSIFMFKVYNRMLPACILDMFSYGSYVHNHSLRCRNDFFLPRIRLDVSKKFVTFAGVQCWSKLPIDIKECNSVYVFKKMLYTLLSSNYE